MSLPLATTTISVYSIQQEGETPDVPYAVPTTAERKQLKQSGVRAVIGAYRGLETIVAGAQQSVASFKLNCDPCNITNEDIIIDEVTGSQYEILWVVPVQGLGINYIRGMITLSSGTEYQNV